MSAPWRQRNLICSIGAGGSVDVVEQPMVPMRTDLIELFERDELAKYLTDDEIALLDSGAWPPSTPPAPIIGQATAASRVAPDGATAASPAPAAVLDATPAQASLFDGEDA
jgi:hypothetical protein